MPSRAEPSCRRKPDVPSLPEPRGSVLGIVAVSAQVEAEQVEAGVAADEVDRTRSSAASTSTLTRWAVVT